MSYRCQNCNKVSQKRERMNKVTTETRKRSYYNVIVANPRVKNVRFLQYREKDLKEIERLKSLNWKVIKESFSEGSEIIREKQLCEKCYKKLEKKEE